MGLVLRRCIGMTLGRELAPLIPFASTDDHWARGQFARAAALPKADNALAFKSDSFHLEDKIRKST